MLNLQHLVLDPVKPRSKRQTKPLPPITIYPLWSCHHAANHRDGDFLAMLAAPWVRERWGKVVDKVLSPKSKDTARKRLFRVRGKAVGDFAKPTKPPALSADGKSLICNRCKREKPIPVFEGLKICPSCRVAKAESDRERKRRKAISTRP